MFGYRIGKEYRDGLTITVLVPDPDEAPVVADVARRVAEGASISGEAKRLNVVGVRTATGAEWSTSTLSRLLQSPTIAGYLVERRVPASGRGYEQVIVRDDAGRPLAAWGPLVEPGAWHRLQEVISARSSGRGPRPTPTLLGGANFFVCAGCGGRMAGDRRSDGVGSYRCATHRRGSATCSGAAVAMSHTDSYLARLVWERAVSLDPTDVDDDRLLRAVALRFNDAAADPETDTARRAAEAVLADTARALEMLDDDRTAGVFAGEEGTLRYRRQVAALSARSEAARASLAALPAASAGEDTSGLLELLSALRDANVVDSPESPWSAWSVAERRDFLALFLARVEVSKAAGRGGGDKVAWRGYERLAVTWADELAPF